MSISNGFIISLSPTHLSVISVKRGRIHQSESTRLDPRDWDDQWDDSLMRLDQPLRQLLSRFSSTPRNAVTLVYHSPTLTSQITSFDQGGAYARETARSKIREVVGLDAAVCVCELGATSSQSGKAMMLAYSDRDETLRAFYAWLNRCGVRVSGMIPSSVATVMIAAEQASKEDGTAGVFYLDKHCSVIGYADSGGDLTLVRPSDIGYETLTESYRQVLGEQGEEADHRDLDLEAQACLFEHGIPFQVHHRGEIELRSSVLPRMAPALQRIGIDVKQTIRFGLGNSSELRKLCISGPGAAIPMMTKAVGEHLELQVCQMPGLDQFDPALCNASGSTEAFFIRMDAQVPSLLPRIADEERGRAQFKRAMIAGVAFAALTMGGQYYLSSQRSIEVEKGLGGEDARYQRVVAFENARAQVQEVQTMLSGIAGLVNDHSGVRPRWQESLASLAELNSAGVRIQEMRGEFDGETPVLVINGYSVADEQHAPEQVLDMYVGALNDLEAVESVELGATTRIELAAPLGQENTPDEWGSQFTLHLRLGSYKSPYGAIAATSDQQDWTQP